MEDSPSKQVNTEELERKVKVYHNLIKETYDVLWEAQDIPYYTPSRIMVVAGKLKQLKQKVQDVLQNGHKK